eukprot:3164482-Rhodomonas_salina.1
MALPGVLQEGVFRYRPRLSYATGLRVLYYCALSGTDTASRATVRIGATGALMRSTDIANGASAVLGDDHPDIKVFAGHDDT